MSPDVSALCSMVKCLSGDRRAVGSSLTSVTALWSLRKTQLSQLSTGATRKIPPCLTERLLMGRKKSNQTNKQSNSSQSTRPVGRVLWEDLLILSTRNLKECFGKNFSTRKGKLFFPKHSSCRTSALGRITRPF